MCKKNIVISRPEHMDLNIHTDQVLKSASLLQFCEDDFFSPWLNSITVLHFFYYCNLKRDNEQ